MTVSELIRKLANCKSLDDDIYIRISEDGKYLELYTSEYMTDDKDISRLLLSQLT